MTPVADQLHDSFTQVLPRSAQQRLVTAYRRPPRWYHTLGHASIVAGHVADLGGDRACLLAAWFHDAVYDARATDNEVQSAELLSQVLVDDPDVIQAARLVRLTATHVPEGPDDRPGAILCDADLAVLGAAPAAYDRYRTAVRREYAHISDDDWRVGRTAVLRGLRDRTALFRTNPGRARWDRTARRNIDRELADLR